tara:strand:+ start:837 stop:1790 length:954 start_codon:yes stop_codon:yes gene_type:complete
MALTFNGTTGISGVDGSASASSYRGTDSNTGLSFAADTVNINTAGLTRTQIDSSGNFNALNRVRAGSSGLGTTPASSSWATNTAVSIIGNFGGGLSINDNGSAGYIHYVATAGTEYSIAQASVGATPSTAIKIKKGSSNFRFNIQAGSDGFNATDYGFQFRANEESYGFINNAISVITLGRQNDGDCMRFFKQSSHRGFIRVETTGGCIFGNLSDYRLKENIVDLTNAITRLKDLKPRRFNWIDDETNTTIDGFIAHEVTAVPEATTGEKDAVDSDNKPVYQGMDNAKLVPLLTAALKEAVGKIEVLETKVAALEAA